MWTIIQKKLICLPFLDEENEDDNLEKLSASLLQKTKLKTEVRFFYEID